MAAVVPTPHTTTGAVQAFAGHRIRQPFPQPGRAAHRLTGAEPVTDPTRFPVRTVPAVRLIGRARTGRARGIAFAAGSGREIVIELEPRIPAGDPAARGDRTWQQACLRTGRRTTRAAHARLSPAGVSGVRCGRAEVIG